MVNEQEVVKAFPKASMTERLPSMDLEEFLEEMREKHGSENARRVELAIDGIFWRESDKVISLYSRFPAWFIARLRKEVKEENRLDYFTI